MGAETGRRWPWEGNSWSRPEEKVARINFQVCPDMEKTGILRHQWNSFQCIERVEDMIGKAIRQQEELWNMLLLILSPENLPLQEPDYDNNPTDIPEELYSEPETNTISPHVLRALKVKVENSMDWCHLALCRLKEIISYNTLSRENVNASSSISPRLNVPLSTEPLFSDREWSQGSGFFSFNEVAAQTCDGGEQQLQDSMSLRAPDDAQGHRPPRSLPTSLLDISDHWNYMLTDSTQALLPSDWPTNNSGAAAPIEALNQSSSGSRHLDHHGADMNIGLSDQTYSYRGGLRPRSSCGPKRDREEADEKDTTVSVVFQELKPGDDTKKGIPDDGHRGWKKYGNKIIQNSNFCRGYYKCSVKECGAKKMVQPTDKNPSIFEVTYVGTHTCSSTSTSRRRHRSRSSATTTTTLKSNTNLRKTPGTPGANATDILVQTKIARLIKNQPSVSNVSSNPSSTISSIPSPVVSSNPSSAISSSPSPIISSNPSPNVSSMSSELDHPLFPPDHPISGDPPTSVRAECDDHHPSSMVDHPSLAQPGSELIGAEMDDLRVEAHVEDDIVYLGQMSLREDEGGAELGFHSDSLLWQDIHCCGSWNVDI